VLAEGVKIAAEKIGKGADKYAMHVKGQELPMHEPRGKNSIGLAYAVSPTGADHMEAPHDPMFEAEGPLLHEMGAIGLFEPVPSIEMSPRKAREFYYTQNLWGMYNSLGMCDFVGTPIGPFKLADMVQYVKAVTGWETSVYELLKVGERANTMSRLFNLREGFSVKDDTLPERLFGGLEGGTLKGVGIDKEQFATALRKYFVMVGWDAETGAPLPEKLEELDIAWASEYLPK
jgi:aldehyde:ferredoxin oxidoreductase